jgi:hypothetical protein
MSVEQSFEINCSNYLGVEHSFYLDGMQALAIAKPSEYQKIRSGVAKMLKEKLLSDCYKTYYQLLTTGDGFGLGNWDSGDKRQPNFPKQKASEFALGATEKLNEILDEVMAIVLPANGANFANQQLQRKAASSNIDI